MQIAARTAAWAKSGYTAKDYVQDGLIAMWDGIESEIDSVVKPVFGSVDLLSAGTITKEGFSISSEYPFYSRSNILTDLVNSNNFTVEIIFSKYGSVFWRCGVYTGRMDALYDSDGNYPKWFARSDNFYNVGFRSTKPYLCCISSVKSGGNFKIYENGVLMKEVSAGNSANAQSGFQIGGYSWQNDYIRESKTSFLRFSIYSKNIDSIELQKNYAIDKARFNLPDAA